MSMIDGIKGKTLNAAAARMRGKSKAKGKGKNKNKGGGKRAEPPIDAKASEGVIVNQLVTQEAQRHGNYAVETLSVTEGDFTRHEKGERSVVRNRSVDAVSYWADKGALDLRQLGVIAIYRRAHVLAFGAPPRVTANWTTLLVGGVRGSITVDDFVSDRIEAMERLKEANHGLFKRVPRYRDTFENAVLHDMPAGRAGHLLGFNSEREARAGTLTVVRFVCDWLATEWRL